MSAGGRAAVMADGNQHPAAVITEFNSFNSRGESALLNVFKLV